MAKDDNNGRGQEKSNNIGHRRNERRPPTIASKAILKLGPPPTSEQTTSVKLNDPMGKEVKERLDNWRDGDNGRILVDMLVKSTSICNKYSFYNANKDWQTVVQGAGRAVTGKCEKEFDKLFNDINNWGAGGANKHKRLVQKLCEKVFKKQGYENQKDAMRDGLTYQGNDHREAIEQLFEVNEILPNMCQGGVNLTPRTFTGTSSPTLYTRRCA